MKTVTITSQGQITIPAAIRKAWGIKGSEELLISFNSTTQRASLEKSMTLDELTNFAMSRINPNAKPVKDVDAYYQAHRHEDIR